MNRIVLQPEEAAVRATEEQVTVLLELYRERDIGLPQSYLDKRQRSLESLRMKLRSILAARDLLPGAPNPEEVELTCLIEKLRGMIKDEPYEVPIAEETKLVELCDKLAAQSADIGTTIAPEHAAGRAALEELGRQ